jgi:hypothetical protein
LSEVRRLLVNNAGLSASGSFCVTGVDDVVGGLCDGSIVGMNVMHGEEGLSLIRSERIDLPAYGCS